MIKKKKIYAMEGIKMKKEKKKEKIAQWKKLK